MICILIVWSLTCHNKSRLENNNWIRTGIIKSRHILYFKIINRNQKCIVMYFIQNADWYCWDLQSEAIPIKTWYRPTDFTTPPPILPKSKSQPPTHQENPSKTIQTKRKIITLRLNQLSTVLFLLLLLLLLFLLALLTLGDRLWKIFRVNFIYIWYPRKIIRNLFKI